MNGKGDENDQPGESEDTPNDSVLGKSQPTPIPDSESRRNQPQAAREPDWQRRNHRVQVVGVIIATVIAAIYGCQLNEMRKSTIATAKAAKAAEDSVTFAETSARLDQRAWITVPRITGVPHNGEIFTVTLVFANSGKTIAGDALVHWVLETVEDGDKPHFEREDNEAMYGTDIGPIIIAPNNEHSLPCTFRPWKTIEQSELDLLQNGDAVIFIHGRIDYKDVFRCPHWTHFCARFDPKEHVWFGCENHNDVDENKCP